MHNQYDSIVRFYRSREQRLKADEREEKMSNLLKRHPVARYSYITNLHSTILCIAQSTELWIIYRNCVFAVATKHESLIDKHRLRKLTLYSCAYPDDRCNRYFQPGRRCFSFFSTIPSLIKWHLHSYWLIWVCLRLNLWIILIKYGKLYTFISCILTSTTISTSLCFFSIRIWKYFVWICFLLIHFSWNFFSFYLKKTIWKL